MTPTAGTGKSNWFQNLQTIKAPSNIAIQIPYQLGVFILGWLLCVTIGLLHLLLFIYAKKRIYGKTDDELASRMVALCIIRAVFWALLKLFFFGLPSYATEFWTACLQLGIGLFVLLLALALQYQENLYEDLVHKYGSWANVPKHLKHGN